MNRDGYSKLINLLQDKIKNTKWEDHLFLSGESATNYIMGKDELGHIDFVIDVPYGSVTFSTWICQSVGIQTTATNPRIDYSNGVTDILFNDCDEIVSIRQSRKNLYNYSHLTSDNAFGTIEDDISVCEFSAHGILINITSGEIVDLYNMGQHDIQSKIIRALSGNTEKGFENDPLRMLRVIKWACQYGWGIEKRTWFHIVKQAHFLAKVDSALIKSELTDILLSDNPKLGIERLVFSGLMEYIIPEFNIMREIDETLYEHTLDTLQNIEFKNITVCYSALLKHIGVIKTVNSAYFNTSRNAEQDSANVAKDILKRLKMYDGLIGHVTIVIENSGSFKNNTDKRKPSKAKLRRFKEKTKQCFDMTLELIHASNKAYVYDDYLQTQIYEIRQRFIDMENEESECPKDLVMPINGTDIMAELGLKSGPLIGLYMRAVKRFVKKNTNASKEDCLQYLRAYTSVND